MLICWLKATGEKTINKKVFLIIAALLGLILGGEMMLPLLEELVILALEWVHKTLDILYEDVLGFGEESAKKASAWTGVLLLIGLIVWGCMKLYQQIRRLIAAFPTWWKESKAEFNAWWSSLSVLYKSLVVFGFIIFLGFLTMLI